MQGYVVCPAEKRFLLLFTFLKKNLNKKVRAPPAAFQFLNFCFLFLRFLPLDDRLTPETFSTTHSLV